MLEAVKTTKVMIRMPPKPRSLVAVGLPLRVGLTRLSGVL
jgi:hypothetical protein